MIIINRWYFDHRSVNDYLTTAFQIEIVSLLKYKSIIKVWKNQY